MIIAGEDGRVSFWRRAAGRGLCPPWMVSPPDMVVSADRALYRAKELGRDRVELSGRF